MNNQTRLAAATAAAQRRNWGSSSKETALINYKEGRITTRNRTNRGPWLQSCYTYTAAVVTVFTNVLSTIFYFAFSILSGGHDPIHCVSPFPRARFFVSPPLDIPAYSSFCSGYLFIYFSSRVHVFFVPIYFGFSPMSIYSTTRRRQL